MIQLDAIRLTPGALTGGATWKEILVRVRVRLADPDRWTQSAFAREIDHRTLVKPGDPRACCWCLLGAIARESNPYFISPPDLLSYLDGQRSKIHGEKFNSLAELNDYVDHQTLLEFLDHTIVGLA